LHCETVGENSVIGAGLIVTKSITENILAECIAAKFFKGIINNEV
jgi:acetyltransferase-like isoleucine patch superfamily enzyme